MGIELAGYSRGSNFFEDNENHEDQEDYDYEEDDSLLGIDTVNKRNISEKKNENQSHINTESLQYEPIESEIWWHHQLQRHFEDKSLWWKFNRRTDLMRWLLTLVTGVLCGSIAYLLTYFTKILSNLKFSVFFQLVDQEKSLSLPMGSSFLFLFFINNLFGLLAFFFVYIEPMAAGSGIPEVKCYLNGLDISSLLTIKTFLCKLFGIVFACAAGLPLGKEGPMVHIGSVIAAEISQGNFLCGYNSKFRTFQDFRNDKEKRDFVACGAASGVGAAFGAPIGGVLFSLEEGASFWSTKLTWRCFFCSMTTVFTLYFISTANSLFGHSDSAAMFSFGEFFSLNGDKSNYSFWELSMFLLIGIMGGLFGAFFNQLAISIVKLRSQYVNSTMRKLFETVLVVSIMSIVSYLLPLLWTKCTPMPLLIENWNKQEKSMVEKLVPMYCSSGSEYNELASLYLIDSDNLIKQLFHFRELGDHNDSTFSSMALFLFFIPYFLLSCLVYGSAVPAGLFVPSLISGASFGRLFGHLLHKLDYTRGTFADSGTYALMGAAAITSGIARMTISLTVMILEATGNMQYVLPLMLTVMIARFVGNVYTDGIYDMHIHFRKLLFLEEEDNFNDSAQLHDLTVQEAMTKNPICLHSIMRVGELYDILQQSQYHCYPIVDTSKPPVLDGIILRKTICTLLKLRAFAPKGISDISTHGGSPLVNWGTLEQLYPNYPDILEVGLKPYERDLYIDLRPYLDRSPYVLNELSSLQRAFRMFRTLGLRHLFVVNKSNEVLGVVTRADLLSVSRSMGTISSTCQYKRKAFRVRNSIAHTIRFDFQENKNAGLSDKLDDTVGAK